jgi:hypothetical protein
MYEIVNRIGAAAMYEQLAEEAAELAHAALKNARVLRGENPTPVTPSLAFDMVIEEYSDVVQCARELNLYPSEDQIRKKERRFLERWDSEHRLDDFLDTER